MLLEDLLEMAKLGADRPLSLWIDDFEKIKANILSQLDKIEKNLSEGTEIKNNIVSLIKQLNAMPANELKIAQGLFCIAEILEEGLPPQHKETINDYIKSMGKFIAQAQAGEFAHEARLKVSASLSIEEQRGYDLKLFQTTGMRYCLEYYLAIYKGIKDALTEEAKRQYIDQEEIDLGSGKVPGLWIDFSHDEVLIKFIYLILDNDLRNRLTKVYFEAKIKMMLIEKPGMDYSQISLEEVLGAFRALLRDLLQAFQSVGIDRLSSFSFAPYGDKPLISEVLKKI